MSLIYLSLHSATAYLSHRNDGSRRTQPAAMVVLWISTMLWLVIGGGLAITLAITRQPICPDPSSKTSNAGRTCLVRYAGLGASLLSMYAYSFRLQTESHLADQPASLTTVALSILVHNTTAPFACHLFGISRTEESLPLREPYRVSHEKAMFSEMSFKCRSSFSPSTCSLSQDASWPGLLPIQSDKAHGLGIFAPDYQRSSTLTPAPSPSSPPGHAKLEVACALPSPSLPPSLALPPQPCHTPSSAQRALRSLDRPLIQSRTKAVGGVVPASPNFSFPNVQSRQRHTSYNSLASDYSQTSIDERQLAPLKSVRTLDADGPVSPAKSPSSAVWMVAHMHDSADLVEEQQGDSDDEIDDAVTLQRRLRSVRNGLEGEQARDQADGESPPRKSVPTPTSVLFSRKRDSEGMFRRDIIGPLRAS